MDVMIVEHAYRALAERYLEKLEGVELENITEQPETSIETLRNLLETIRNCAGELEFGKVNQWVGYIQGVMACYGLLSVDVERNFTRPIFNPTGELPTVDCVNRD